MDENLTVIIHPSLVGPKGDLLVTMVDQLEAAKAAAVALLSTGEGAVLTEDEGTEPVEDLLVDALYSLGETVEKYARR